MPWIIPPTLIKSIGSGSSYKVIKESPFLLLQQYENLPKNYSKEFGKDKDSKENIGAAGNVNGYLSTNVKEKEKDKDKNTLAFRLITRHFPHYKVAEHNDLGVLNEAWNTLMERAPIEIDGKVTSKKLVKWMKSNVDQFRNPNYEGSNDPTLLDASFDDDIGSDSSNDQDPSSLSNSATNQPRPSTQASSNESPTLSATKNPNIYINDATGSVINLNEQYEDDSDSSATGSDDDGEGDGDGNDGGDKWWNVWFGWLEPLELAEGQNVTNAPSWIDGPMNFAKLLMYPPDVPTDNKSPKRQSFQVLRERALVRQRRIVLSAFTTYCLIIRYCSFDTFILLMLISNACVLFFLKNSRRINMQLAKRSVRQRVGWAKQWAGGLFKNRKNDGSKPGKGAGESYEDEEPSGTGGVSSSVSTGNANSGQQTRRRLLFRRGDRPPIGTGPSSTASSATPNSASSPPSQSQQSQQPQRRGFFKKSSSSNNATSSSNTSSSLLTNTNSALGSQTLLSPPTVSTGLSGYESTGNDSVSSMSTQNSIPTSTPSSASPSGSITAQSAAQSITQSNIAKKASALFRKRNNSTSNASGSPFSSSSNTSTPSTLQPPVTSSSPSTSSSTSASSPQISKDAKEKKEAEIDVLALGSASSRHARNTSDPILPPSSMTNDKDKAWLPTSRSSSSIDTVGSLPPSSGNLLSTVGTGTGNFGVGVGTPNGIGSGVVSPSISSYNLNQKDLPPNGVNISTQVLTLSSGLSGNVGPNMNSGVAGGIPGTGISSAHSTSILASLNQVLSSPSGSLSPPAGIVSSPGSNSRTPSIDIYKPASDAAVNATNVAGDTKVNGLLSTGPSPKMAESPTGSTIGSDAATSSLPVPALTLPPVLVSASAAANPISAQTPTPNVVSLPPQQQQQQQSRKERVTNIVGSVVKEVKEVWTHVKSGNNNAANTAAVGVGNTNSPSTASALPLSHNHPAAVGSELREREPKDKENQSQPGSKRVSAVNLLGDKEGDNQLAGKPTNRLADGVGGSVVV
ncbi:hypothetical protein BKA69DRAFT_1041891 [Paraphysoderma sedebokerense]|nr:hypothetical protein BKA69DRAFT_1041891 [Paraphysoderma sedebokerense]